MLAVALADEHDMTTHDRARRSPVAIGRPKVKRRRQPKLEVGAVDDPLEAEAEATADRVMSAIQSSGGEIARIEDEELLQGSRAAHRMGLEEEDLLQGSRTARSQPEEEELMASRTARSQPEEEELMASRIARSAIGPEGGEVDPELESRLTAGSGSALPDPVRSTMESAFNVDFSDVRVNENPAATEIGARAYTTGTDISFAPGQFKPASAEGQHLLAHELTHVVQQGGAAARSPLQRDGDPAAAAKAALVKFKSDRPAFAPLVAGLGHVVGDTGKLIDFLLTNFQNRNDFSYVGGTMGTWQAMGDCSTLADQFVQILHLAGVADATTKTVNNEPMYVPPTPIIDSGGQTGNVQGGAGGWFFVNHTWVVAGGQEIDILYGTKGRVASQGGFQLSDETGERIFSNGTHTIKSTKDGPVHI